MRLVDQSAYKLGWLSTLSLLLMLVSGCGGGGGDSASPGTTPVTISFGVPVAQVDPTQRPDQKQINLALQNKDRSQLQRYSDAVANILLPSAHAAPPPAGVTSVKVTITGIGMATMVDIVLITVGAVVTRNYSVLSGANRNFLIQAYSGAGATGTLLFQGNANANLQAGVPVTLNVPMLAVVDTTPPVITLLGVNPVTVAQGAVYTDAGATALDNVDGDITANIVTVNPVNTAVIGTYTVTYDVSDAALNPATQVTRTVNVVAVADVTPPVITLLGANPVTVAQGAVYTDAGATALDDVDGDITANIVTVNSVNTAVIGTYTVTYNVSDAALNPAAQVTRTVNVVVSDLTPPVITLTGGNINVVQGGVFTEPGFLATDNVDGNITANVVVTGGPVNSTAAVGTVFTLNYNVSDAAGNAAVQKTRTVTITSVMNFGHVGMKPSGETFYDVAWNGVTGAGSMTVAVGVAGVFASQDGGITWTKTTASAKTGVLWAVSWGGSGFVAVGDTGAIFSSADGITWSKQISGTANQLKSVAWGGAGAAGKYVVIGQAGILLTSPDGVTWTVSPTPVPGGAATHIMYDFGLFVATTHFSLGIITSTDGLNWTAATVAPGPTQLLTDVIYTGTMFVAVGQSNNVYTSVNGTTWAPIATPPPAGNWTEVVFDGTNLILLSTFGGYSYSSDGGATWSPIASFGSADILYGALWDGAQFIAVGTNGTVLSGAWGGAGPTLGWTRLDTWLPSVTSLSDITWAAGTYVAVGANGGTNAAIKVSNDGLLWSDPVSMPAVSRHNAVASNGANVFVAIGNAGSILTSVDSGSTWLAYGTAVNQLNDIIWDGTQFIVVGNAGTILTSADGLTWAPQGVGVTAGNLSGIAWSGLNYVICMGSANTALTSPDSTTWSLQAVTAVTYGVSKIVWDGTQYVGVAGVNGAGINGVIHTSPDGINWTTRFTTGFGLSGIAWTGTETIVVGGWNASQILSSTDGITWVSNNPGSYSHGINAIVQGSGGQLVAVGGNALGTHAVILVGP